MDAAGTSPPRGRDGGLHVVVGASGFHPATRTPDAVEDHQGRVWLVEEVVARWESPEYVAHGWARPVGAVAETWDLSVTGPVPGGGRGRMRVQLRGYGDGAGYWMAAEPVSVERLSR